jgi:predicted metal-dependent hydrolase
MLTLKYLSSYPPELIAKVEVIIAEQRLSDVLLSKYPEPHKMRTDCALYDYTMHIKNSFLGKSMRLNRVIYDSKIKVIEHALGQHHYITRVHGNKTKTVNEIKIASLFKAAPEAFLKMIVTHELSHFREKEHNKSFYQLCRHLEPNYHQYEFDLRLYLTHLDLYGELYL